MKGFARIAIVGLAGSVCLSLTGCGFIDKVTCQSGGGIYSEYDGNCVHPDTASPTPESNPGVLPPQNDPGVLPPQNDPGAYPPQNDPGVLPPQNDPGVLPPQNDPGAYPPGG